MTEHVCGLQGFGEPGDVCPRCEENWRNRPKRTKLDAALDKFAKAYHKGANLSPYSSERQKLVDACEAVKALVREMLLDATCRYESDPETHVDTILNEPEDETDDA